MTATRLCLACGNGGPLAGKERHRFTCERTFQAWPRGADGIATMHAVLADQERVRVERGAALMARVAALEAAVAGR
jgi:uncharacterized membrane protein YidH (DUF202 family)